MRAMRSVVSGTSTIPRTALLSASPSPFWRTERHPVPSPRRIRSLPPDHQTSSVPPPLTKELADREENTKSSLPGWLTQLVPPMALCGIFAVALGPVTGLGEGFDATDPVSVTKALGILAVVVAVHECGHFLAARLQNIHVSKFAIGFGPAVVRYQGRIVEYSLRALPLGGFVAFPDDDPDCPYPADDPNLLRNRPILDRAVVISAGVIANIIFAFAILVVQASTVGISTETLQPGVVVPKVIKNSVAAKAGVMPGDVIMAVDGRWTAPDPSTVSSIVQEIESHPDREMTLSIERQGKPITLAVTPSTGSDGQGRLGIQLVAKRQFSTRIAHNPVEATSLASREFLKLNAEILDGLRQLVFNFSKSSQQVSGPIAIVAMGAEVARFNASQLYLFAAVVNLNLAIINTLPLPALDGGYFALLILEALRGGKKLPQEVEQGVMASGLLFLLAVGCVLAVRDTVHLL